MMRPADLRQLHILLAMYRNIYGSVPVGFMEQVAEQYHAAAICHCGVVNEIVLLITNLRRAGRKSRIRPEEKEQILYEAVKNLVSLESESF